MPLTAKEIRIQVVSDDGSVLLEKRLDAAANPNSFLRTGPTGLLELNTAGDFMSKAVYDADDNGIVDKSESLDDGVTNFTVAEVQVIEATAQQGVVDAAGAQATIDLHLLDFSNPHNVTPAQIGAADAVHTHDASDIVSGTIDVARLPASVFERVYVVADEAARYALTTAEVQEGDVVKQVAPDNTMYFVVDDTNLGNAAGYEVFNAGVAAAVPWTGVTGKPTYFDSHDSGRVYYVNALSPEAEDAPRTGWLDTDPRKPWATIQAAVDAARSDFNGDNLQRAVRVVAGTYDETVGMLQGVNLILDSGVKISRSGANSAVVYSPLDFVDPTQYTAHIFGDGEITSASGDAINAVGDWTGVAGALGIIVKAHKIGKVNLNDDGVTNFRMFDLISSDTSLGAFTCDKMWIGPVRCFGAGNIVVSNGASVATFTSREAAVGSITVSGASSIGTLDIYIGGAVSIDDGSSLPRVFVQESLGSVSSAGAIEIFSAKDIGAVTVDVANSTSGCSFKCRAGLITGGVAITDDGGDPGATVSLSGCSLSGAISLTNLGAGTELRVWNCVIYSGGPLRAILNTASNSATIRVLSAACNVQLLDNNLTNLVESPLLVIDPEIGV